MELNLKREVERLENELSLEIKKNSSLINTIDENKLKFENQATVCLKQTAENEINQDKISKLKTDITLKSDLNKAMNDEVID